MERDSIDNINKRSFFYINELTNSGSPNKLEISEKIHQAMEKAYERSESEENENTIFTELEKRFNEIESNDYKESIRLNKKLKKSLVQFHYGDKQNLRDDFQLWNLNRDELKLSSKLIENTKAYKYNKICRHILKKRHIKLSANLNNKKNDKLKPKSKDSELKRLAQSIKYSLVKSLIKND